MQNRKLSIHQEHELLLKLEQAGLDHFLTQAVVESPDNLLAKHLVASLLIKHFKIDLSPWTSLDPVSYSRGELLNQYATHNCKTSEGSGYLLNFINLYKISNKINLISLTYEELGYTGNQMPTTKEIYTRAHLIGLQICPLETGPILRLAYLKQPRDERMLIAMRPIKNRDGDYNIFCLAHDVFGLALTTDRFNSFLPVQKHKTKWVFVVPDK
jgi:hypothetical protein